MRSFFRNRGPKLKVGDEVIRYDVVYRDVSHPRLRVTDKGRVELILPLGTDTDPRSFILGRREWILRKIGELRDISSFIDKYRGSEGKLLLFGKFYDVKTRFGSKRGDVSLRDGEVVVNLPEAGQLYEHLKAWVKRSLSKVLNDYLRKYEELMGVKVKRVYIRNLQRKWGSRSSEGNVSFNLMLAALPNDLIEYVVAHELAHFLEPSHGRNFQRLLESFCPDYREKELLLAKYRPLIEGNSVWRKLRRPH